MANLILVQGRWFNLRNSSFIRNFLYKKILFAFPLFIFAWYSNFGGLMLYEQWYAALYNTFFSSGPVLVLALYDVDIHWLVPRSLKDRNKKNIPEIITRPYVKEFYHKLYYITRDGFYFSYRLMTEEIFVIIIQASFIAFTSIYSVQDMVTLPFG